MSSTSPALSRSVTLRLGTSSLPRPRRESTRQVVTAPHYTGLSGRRRPAYGRARGAVVARYLARRLALAIVIVGVAMAILFGAVHLVPGDPASVALGPRATPEM